MYLPRQSVDNPATSKHRKKVTSIIQLFATHIEEALKKQGSMPIVKKSIQKMKTQTYVSVEMAKSTSKQNPHERRFGCLMEVNITESDMARRPPS
jgi:hypothetical protein